MSLLTMALICGVMSTMFVNPFLVFRFIKGIIDWLKAGKGKRSKLSCYLNFQEIIRHPVGFLVVQVIFFLLGAASSIVFYYTASPRIFVTIIGVFWIIAIWQISNLGALSDFCFIDEGDLVLSSFAFVGVLAIIWLGVVIHKPVYDFAHPVSTNTYIQEEKVPVVSIDVLESLEKECILEGYTMREPICRNGKVVYPLSRGANVSIAGYIILDGEQPIFVRKELTYTPYQDVKNNVKMVFRKEFPTKILFGDWSFQLDNDGEVWFANVYGHYACLKAGRELEGIALINATSGECVTYNLASVPNWVSGISE